MLERSSGGGGGGGNSFLTASLWVIVGRDRGKLQELARHCVVCSTVCTDLRGVANIEITHGKLSRHTVEVPSFWISGFW